MENNMNNMSFKSHVIVDTLSIFLVCSVIKMFDDTFVRQDLFFTQRTPHSFRFVDELVCLIKIFSYWYK